jgi:hypothetical protein
MADTKRIHADDLKKKALRELVMKRQAQLLQISKKIERKYAS